MEDDKIKKNKQKKIGFKTLGIMLIIFGIIFFIQSIFKVDVIRYVFIAWPIFFIILGIEILVTDKNKDVKISIGSIFLIIILIGTSFLFGTINMFLNEVLYSDEFIENLSNRSGMYYISGDDEINITNYAKKEVNLKIIESKEEDSKIYYDVEYKIEDDRKNNLPFFISYINNDLEILNRTDRGIEIYDIKENVEIINITVVTNSKEKVKVNGNVILE